MFERKCSSACNVLLISLDLSRNELESIEPFIRLAPQISELTMDSNKISAIGTWLSLLSCLFFYSNC
jgi:Leucine-rich repeat (LRR) protein